MAVPSLRRRTLAVDLTDQLRELIQNGDLAPGARLQEAELSDRFGVSRTPLREALKTLASEGLITIAPNRGATVTQLTAAEVAETFPIMGALEALAGELACERADAGDLAELRRLHDAIVTHYQARDLAGYFATNRQFHERLLAAARNATLAEQYHQLAGRVRQSRYQATMSPERWARSVREHEEIIAALEAGDRARLAKVLRAHVDHKFETVRDALGQAAVASLPVAADAGGPAGDGLAQPGRRQ